MNSSFMQILRKNNIDLSTNMAVFLRGCKPIFFIRIAGHTEVFSGFLICIDLKKKTNSQNQRTVQTVHSNITRRVTPAFCTISKTKHITLSLKKIQMVEFILIGQIKQAI